MSTDSVVRSSISEEAVLEVLLGAGLDRTQATTLIEGQLEQSSNTLPGCIGPEVRGGERGGEGLGRRSTFDHSVMETLKELSQTGGSYREGRGSDREPTQRASRSHHKDCPASFSPGCE